MITKTPWFERTFEFNFPVGIFPCILERIRGTPARIVEITRLLPRDILTTKVDNTWSILEQIGHLYDLDELHEARLSDFLSHAKELRAADLKNQKTHLANHNATSLEKLQQQFKEARQQFVAKLETMSEAELQLVSIHPRLRQPMRMVDMAYFVAEHDDHHLARATELIRILTEEK